VLVNDLIVRLGVKVTEKSSIAVLDKTLTDFSNRQMTLFQRLNSIIERTTSLIAGMLAGYSATMTGVLSMSARVASRTQVLSTVMEQVAKSVGVMNEQLKIQQKRMVKNGISTQEATNGLIRFMQAELDVKKAADLSRAAQDIPVGIQDCVGNAGGAVEVLQDTRVCR